MWINISECKEYSQFVYENVINSDGVVEKVDRCGLQKTESFVDGRRVKPGEYPHLARIGFGVGESFRWRSSGSIISSRFVLTVAGPSVLGM